MRSTFARLAPSVARFAGLVVVAACAWPLSAARAQGSDHGLQDALGPLYREAPYAQRTERPPHPMTLLGMVRHWNEAAIDASGVDHTPVAAGEQRVYGEQLGPGRASRAMAIVHIAVFEAVNAVLRRYQSYVGLPAAARGTSPEAAIAQAAHDTLAALYPSQRGASTLSLRRTSPRSGIRMGRISGPRLDSALPPRSWRCGPPTGRRMRSRGTASTTCRAPAPASGGRIR
jgi:hypothetical protein